MILKALDILSVKKSSLEMYVELILQSLLLGHSSESGLNNFVVCANGHCRKINVPDWIVGVIHCRDGGIVSPLGVDRVDKHTNHYESSTAP